MIVNWDEVAKDAEGAIPVILAELLATAEDISNLVVVYHLKDGSHHVARNVKSLAMQIGMLEYAKHQAMLEIDAES